MKRNIVGVLTLAVLLTASAGTIYAKYVTTQTVTNSVSLTVSNESNSNAIQQVNELPGQDEQNNNAESTETVTPTTGTSETTETSEVTGTSETSTTSEVTGTSETSTTSEATGTPTPTPTVD